jgi:hypothetical protein
MSSKNLWPPATYLLLSSLLDHLTFDYYEGAVIILFNINRLGGEVASIFENRHNV